MRNQRGPDLIGKLERQSDETKNLYNQKKQQEYMIKQTSEMAKQKVQELEDELEG